MMRLARRVRLVRRQLRVRTHPVGHKRPNLFGLFDMYGNVWEWCWGGFTESSTGHRPGMTRRVRMGSPTGLFVGGGWHSGVPSRCRSAHHLWYPPGYRDSDTGFRVTRKLLQLC